MSKLNSGQAPRGREPQHFYYGLLEAKDIKKVARGKARQDKAK